jgi:hypothetical protein
MVADFAYEYGRTICEVSVTDTAVEIIVSLLTRFEDSLGPHDPCVITWLKYLGGHAYQLGETVKSEMYFRRAFDALRESAVPTDEQTRSISLILKHLLQARGAFDEAEKISREELESIQRALGPEHPDTLSSANSLASLLNDTDRRPEALALLRNYAALSDDARDAVAYNLACYECLEGNHEEARRLIGEHLAKHPEMKDQALADEDFAAIREWIESLT